ncbi:hypothetical protein [Halorarius halobius]|uniref:DUF7847 domain-containing protein n=1 Tax=Halorarius halobius TaxID=2962671 RepID=UPI0020CE8973|nr:hypothetical protein [Halorarius halobius]
MAVVQALQSASRALRRNPIIAGIVLVVTLLQMPTQFGQLADPLVSAVLGLGFTVVTVIVAPFVFGGLIGMADEALSGTTTFDTFVETGKQYYISLLGAYLLLLGGMILLWIIGSIVSLVLIAGLGIASGGVSGTASPAFIAMFLIGTGVSLIFLFGPLFFVQFYGQAIVLDGKSAIGGFKHSVGLVRRNLVSVFGYSVLVFAGGMFFGLLGSIPSMLLSMQMTDAPMDLPLPEVALPVAAALTVLGYVVLGLLGSLFMVFSVAFYRTLDSTDPTSDPPSMQEAVA